jgi:hypothetical protein
MELTLKQLLEYLDGRGLILTDDELIEEALEDLGEVKTITPEFYVG